MTPLDPIERAHLKEPGDTSHVMFRYEPPTAAEVAAELGYADQPHFIRDFSRVTSMTPGAFAALHTP